MSPGRIEADGEVIAATNPYHLEAEAEYGGGRVSLRQDEEDRVYMVEFEVGGSDEFGEIGMKLRRSVNVKAVRVPIVVVTNQGRKELALVVD